MMGIIVLLWMERPPLIRSRMVLLINIGVMCGLVVTINISAANKPSGGGDATLVLVIAVVSLKTQTHHGVGDRRRVVL